MTAVLSSLRLCAGVVLVVAVTLGLAALLDTGHDDAAASSAELLIDPTTQSVSVNTTATVSWVQNSTVDTSGVQADLSFDPDVLHVESVALGPPYTGAALLLGVAPQTQSQAIAAANQSGTLENVAAAFQDGSSFVPAGNAVAIVVSFRGCAAGVSPMSLSNPEMIDAAGQPLETVSLAGGTLTVTPGTAPDADGDGVIDACDNCPTWLNPSQALPNWTVPAGDSDCDGFDSTKEATIGTIQTVQCPATVTPDDEDPDPWPPDLNDDRSVNEADTAVITSFWGWTVPPAPSRGNLYIDTVINIQDIAATYPYYNKTCSPGGP